MLPDGLEERYRALRRRPKERAALRSEREAAVVSVAYATQDAYWIPRPALDPPENTAPPERVEQPGERDALAGLDAGGRPALVRSAFTVDRRPAGAVLAAPGEQTDEWVIHSRLLTWDGPRLEVVGFLTHTSVSHVSWIDFDRDGHPVRFARAGVEYNDLGKGAEVAECEWDGDRCVRVRRRTADERGRVRQEALTGEHDDAGLLRVVRDDGLVTWRRDLHGWEADPLPVPQAFHVLGDAILDAAERVVAEVDPVDPFLLDISPHVAYDSLPDVQIGDAALLATVRGRVRAADLVLALRRTESHALTEHLGHAGLRALRTLRQAEDADWSIEALRALQRRAVERTWPGDALPLVSSLDLAREVLGEERIAAVLDRVGEPPPRPAVERPPRSRDEAAALLRAARLPEAPAAQAAWGVALLAGGRGASRLGGRPDLPEGMGWPVFEDRPLTHMASIDLAELPAIEGRDVLPPDGTLVLFAGLTEEDDLVEPTRASDPRVRVLHVPAGAPTHRPKPPPDPDRDEYAPPVVMRQRRVRFQPVLTLPERPEGLPDALQPAYEDLWMALLEVTPGHRDPAHLMLGHPAVVQWDPRAPGEVSVLHMGWDEELGFQFLDGGDLTLYGSADDVRAGRWDRLTVSTESN